MMFLLFGSVALSVGSRSSMVKVICLAVLEGGPGCGFTTKSMQQSLSSPRPVEDGYHGSWMLDFTCFFFFLVAERNSFPVPMPRKRRPQSGPHPSDQSQQPPVPRPRSKLTEVTTLDLLGPLARCAGSLLHPPSACTWSPAYGHKRILSVLLWEVQVLS